METDDKSQSSGAKSPARYIWLGFILLIISTIVIQIFDSQYDAIHKHFEFRGIKQL